MSNARRDEERDTMTTLTPEDRARLRDLAGKATPGPWEASWTVDDGELTVSSGTAPPDAEFIAAARTAVPALLDALDEAERAVAYVQLVQAVAAVTPCSCSAQRARAGRAEAEVERLHSWAGLMELLDEHYPADLIPTAPDDPARDAGPRIVSLIRRVDAAEAARDAAERQVKAVRSIVDEHRAGRRGTTSQLSFEGEALLLTSLSHALDGEAGR